MKQAARRDETVGARVTDIGFGRAYVSERPAGLSPRRAGLRHSSRRRVAGFGEQLPDHALGHVIFALAVMEVADAALRIDEVMRGPVLVLERAPQHVAVVERDRVADAEVLDRARDIFGLALEGELGRVDANYDEP